MPMTCPYCLRENPYQALVCDACSRDIAIPDAVAAERLDLIQKRDAISAELKRIEQEIAALHSKRSGRDR
jgi:hypothetical protein